MDRKIYRPLLETAVTNTNLRFPNFQGVVIFGSFVTDKPEPSDIDIIPVMQKYDGNWDFSPVSECDSHDDHPDYYEFTDSENYFLSHFPVIFTKEEILCKSMNKAKRRGIHCERLIAFNDLSQLRRSIPCYFANPENFVGREQARKTLFDILYHNYLSYSP